MVVYFIQRESDKAIKIGFSHRMRNRLNSLKTETNESLEVLCIIDGGRPIEKALHNQFSYCRKEGEWFYPHMALSKYISDLRDESLDFEDLPSSTTMCIKKKTKDRLSNFGRAGESLETALIRALDLAEECKKIREAKT